MENKEIARLLSETADLMEIAGEDGFRIRSYRNGASGYRRVIPSASSISCAPPSAKSPTLPGIGKGIALVLAEIVQRGLLRAARRDCWRSIRRRRSNSSRSRGSVPKASRCIFRALSDQHVDELESLCQEQKLRTLPRMGAKLEEKVLRSIAAVPPAHRALPAELWRAAIAAELIAELRQLRGIERVTPPAACGAAEKRSAISTCWSPARGATRSLDRLRHTPAHEVLGRGENKASVDLGWKACRWTCARCRPRASARRCSTSPAARTTTSSIRHCALKHGPDAQRVRPVPLEGNDARGGRDAKKRSTSGSGFPGFRRSCARTAARSKPRRRAACRRWWNSATFAATCTCTPPRPTAGRRCEEMAEAAARNGLRVHRDHRSFEGARHGERPGRGPRGRLRAPGARDQPQRIAAAAFLRHRMRHPAQTARWTSPTTRWPNSTS